jgi:hypothetical protein
MKTQRIPTQRHIDLDTQFEITSIRFSETLEQLNSMMTELTSPDDNPDYYERQTDLTEELHYLSSLLQTLSQIKLLTHCPHCGQRL